MDFQRVYGVPGNGQTDIPPARVWATTATGQFQRPEDDNVWIAGVVMTGPTFAATLNNPTEIVPLTST